MDIKTKAEQYAEKFRLIPETKEWYQQKVDDFTAGYEEALRQFTVSGSLFYQKVEKLVNEWKEKELGEIAPYSPEAEIEAGFRIFLRWLKEHDIQ